MFSSFREGYRILSKVGFQKCANTNAAVGADAQVQTHRGIGAVAVRFGRLPNRKYDYTIAILAVAFPVEFSFSSCACVRVALPTRNHIFLASRISVASSWRYRFRFRSRYFQRISIQKSTISSNGRGCRSYSVRRRTNLSENGTNRRRSLHRHFGEREEIRFQQRPWRSFQVQNRQGRSHQRLGSGRSANVRRRAIPSHLLPRLCLRQSRPPWNYPAKFCSDLRRGAAEG